MNTMTKSEEERIYGRPDGGYNGWRNYATWNIALWLGNDEGLYFSVIRERHTATYNGFKRGKDAKQFCLDYFPHPSPNSTPDGVRIDGRNIDWVHIAEAMREMCDI